MYIHYYISFVLKTERKVNGNAIQTDIYIYMLLFEAASVLEEGHQFVSYFLVAVTVKASIYMNLRTLSPQFVLCCFTTMVGANFTVGHTVSDETSTTTSDFSTTGFATTEVGDWWVPEERGGHAGNVNGLESPCESFKFVLSGVLTCGIVILGYMGNTLSIFTLWPKRSQISTAYVLICLAFLDNILLTVSLFNNTVPTFCSHYRVCDYYMKRVNGYVTYCARPIGGIAHFAATWVIVLVTLQRYVGVCYPLKMSRWCRISLTYLQVSLIHLFAILFNLVRFFVIRPVVTFDGNVIVRFQPWRESVYYKYVYNLFLAYTLLYLIPFLALLVMTCKLIKALHASRAVHDQLTGSKKREERDLTLTLVVVVVIFMTSQLTGPIRRVFLAFDPLVRWGDCSHAITYLQPVFDVIVSLNSAVNILVYGLCGRRFRSTLIGRLKDLSTRSNKITPTSS